jgi:hypothetical protein
MNNLDLTLDDLVEVVRTCDAIEIESCNPPYLKDFIAARLMDTFPGLSTKVRGYDEEQMHGVCEHVKATFALLRCGA